MTIDFEYSRTKKIKRIRSSSRRRDPQREDLRWWLKDDDELHRSVAAVTSRIADRLSGVRDRQVINRLMYEEIDAYQRYGFGPDVSAAERHGRVTMNVVQSTTDTVAAMIVRNRPRALFLTSGADYKLRKRARLLTKVVHAIMQRAGCYDVSEEVFTDGAVEKGGAFHLYVEHGEIRCISVPPNELLIDQSEGRRKFPTQVHRQKPVPRDELLHTYRDKPELVEAIENASPCDGVGGDMVHVIESWRLESGKGAGDGRHAISIDGATLLSEPWTKPYYPFVWYRWYKAGHGWWGRSIPDEIGSIQRVINALLSGAVDAVVLAAAMKWLVARQAQVNKDHLASNHHGAMVEYNWGQWGPPQPATPNVMPEWVVPLIWALYDRAIAIVGSNPQMASGTKPPGVESARAMREASDLAGGRVQVPAQRFEQCFPLLAEIVVDMAKDLYGADNDVEILVQDRQDAVLAVKWRDVDMERDKYKITVFPVSALPTSPQGRLAQVQELVQAGFLSWQMALELLDFPDLESETNKRLATKRIVEATIELILEQGEYPVKLKPLPQWDLAYAAEEINAAVPIAQMQGASDTAIQLLMLYAEDVQTLLEPQKLREQQIRAQAQAATQPQGPPMQGGPPMPPPGGAPPGGAPPAPRAAA